MKFILTFLTFLLFAGNPDAEAQVIDTSESGNMVYFYPEKLDTLLRNFIAINKEKGTFNGYRIQLMATPNRQAVLKFKSEFYREFPDKRPVIVYQQPNFKLREGAYRSKLEAYKSMLDIQQKFPDAFIVNDEIPFKDL